MAISKCSIAALLLCLLLVHHHQMVDAAGPNSQQIDCEAACTARCKESSRPNLCNRACGTCCARCNCVPPGTSGNLENCPCYFNQTTRGGVRKCP